MHHLEMQRTSGGDFLHKEANTRAGATHFQKINVRKGFVYLLHPSSLHVPVHEPRPCQPPDRCFQDTK